jgi:hypothetical protein
MYIRWEPGWHRRYGDWLRTGQLRGQSLSPRRVKNFLFSKLSIWLWGSTQPPIQWVPSSFPGGKAAGAWSWPLTSSECQGQENVNLYIHSPIRLHGAVLNSLSTGLTLPFLYYVICCCKSEPWCAWCVHTSCLIKISRPSGIFWKLLSRHWKPRSFENFPETS